MKKIVILTLLVLLIMATSGCISRVITARLSNILVDGKQLEEFHPHKLNYIYVLPNGYENEMPEVIGIPEKPTSVVNNYYPEQIPGTVILSVMPQAEQGETVEETRYKITFIFSGK